MAWSNRTENNRDIFVRRNGETTAVTQDSEIDAEPALSPDGDVLIWSRRTEQDWDLYISVDNGPGEALIAEPGPQRKPVFSADGSTLVFEDRGGIGVWRGGEREWIAEPNDSEVSQNPKVSEDGTRVFWERFDQNSRTKTLWMRDQDGAEKALLSPEDAWTGYAVSKNGQQLTYSVFTDKGEDLKVWDLASNEVSDLANKEDVNESFPAVTLDGRSTFYSLADFRKWPKVDTYIFHDREGKKEELVTRDPVGRHLFPQVSSEGNLLHWMWIDDADPLDRALYASPL